MLLTALGCGMSFDKDVTSAEFVSMGKYFDLGKI